MASFSLPEAVTCFSRPSPGSYTVPRPTAYPRHRLLFVQLCRGAMLVATTAFILLALKVLRLAQSFAITLFTRLLATILAMVFQKEWPSLARWIVILVGLASVMVALQPTAPTAGAFVVFPIAVALAKAAHHVITRSIAADKEPPAMRFHVGCFALLLTKLELPLAWSLRARWEWRLLAVGGARLGWAINA